MKSVSVENKIRNWASGLGFRLSDGSTPDADYFASLIETPHRLHLWEEILESVLPRKKVEHMRKQVLVAKIQDKMKFSRKNNSILVNERIDFWNKLNGLLPELRDKRNEVIKLEAVTMTKSSDLFFEICKLAELEKKFDESSDKLLILKLFSKRKMKLIDELEGRVLKSGKVSNIRGKFEDFQGNSHISISQLINTEEFNSLLDECSNKAEWFHIPETLEPYLWEKFIKSKKNLLQHFFDFLIQLNSSEKYNISEKVAEMEKNLIQLVEKLKQKMTEKSLEVMIRSTTGTVLESEIEKLKEELMVKKLHDGNRDENFSSIDKLNEYYGRNEEKNHKNLNNHLDVMGQKSYREFLKEELNRLENEEQETRRTDCSGKDEEASECVAGDIAGEINSHKLEIKEVENEIHHCHVKFEKILRSLKGKTAEMRESKDVEETAEKLKSTSEKQIDILLEVPLDAFRTFKCSSGKILFEYESESHCLENYGGEFKQFFSTILIPPLNVLSKIISEVSDRKQTMNEVKKFISGKDKLASVERKVQNQVDSIKYDLQLCEKNFKESDGILWNTTSKTNQLFREIDFAEKILKSLLEQPYRLMIPEIMQGESYKNFEEQYEKEKNK